MKVLVNVQIASKIASSTALELVVGTNDTVASVKDRVAMAELISFPDLDLLLDGEVLEDEKQLSDCGVKEKCSLDLVVKASEESLIRQLTELLQFQELHHSELSMMYCYKHGASIAQALKTVGESGKLLEFVKKHKQFSVKSDKVALVPDESPQKPITSIVATEVTAIMKENGSGTMEIKDLCTKFSQKFHVSLSRIVAMKADEFFAKEKDLFVTTGRGQVSLKSSLPALPPKPSQKPCPTKTSRKTQPEKSVPVHKSPSSKTRPDGFVPFYEDGSDDDDGFYGPSDTKVMRVKVDAAQPNEDLWTSEGDANLFTTGSSSDGSDDEQVAKQQSEIAKKRFRHTAGRPIEAHSAPRFLQR